MHSRSVGSTCLFDSLPSVRAWLVAAVALLASGAEAQVNVLTAHNDIARTGQNVNETALTTSNVNSAQFGLLFTQPVNGKIFAQPLYTYQLPIGQVSHNVVYVATSADMVYA